MENRQAVREDFAHALRSEVPAAELDDMVSKHFPELNAFRENDDLILVIGEGRRLMVRRVGPDRFLTSDAAAASGSTNLLDAGEGTERDLDALIDEIAAFAAL